MLRGSIGGFIVDEDPNHLEEAFLLAIDAGIEEDVQWVRPEAGNKRRRADIDSTMPTELQPRIVGWLAEMELAQFEIDVLDNDFLN